MNDASNAAANKPEAAAPIRYLRQPEVLARVGVTWITILRWEKKGLFPKRRKIGPRVVAWIESEIDEWCALRAGVLDSEREAA